MKLYKFTITLEEQVDDLDMINAFYGQVNDASMADAKGQTLIHYDREADSLDRALASAIEQLRTQGWHVREITVEPESVSSSATP